MKIKKINLVLIFCAFFTSLFTSIPVLAESVYFTDALNRSVELPRPPERIVLAGKAVIMLMDALYLFPGAGERIVAIGKTDQGLGDFFPVLEDNHRNVTPLGKNAGPEQIAAMNPDLVILKSYMRGRLGLPLEQLGISVCYLDLETPEQFNRDIRTLGQILDQPRRSVEILNHYSLRLGRLTEQAADKPSPRVALLSVSSGDQGYTYNVAPPEWIQTTMVKVAGGIPVWTEAAVSPGWNQISFEQLAVWDPDVILLVSFRMNSMDVLGRLSNDPLWQSLKAVQSERFFAMPADYYSWGQPDTRWILGTQWIQRAIYPDLPHENAVDDVRRFFKDFYNLPDQRIEAEIIPVIQGSFFE